MPMDPEPHRELILLGWEFSRISAASLAHSRSTCSFWVRTEVYSPIPMEKAPAISPGETGEHDETRSCTGGADTRDEREVGHQAVHRSEDRGAQRAAGSGCGQSP